MENFLAASNLPNVVLKNINLIVTDTQNKITFISDKFQKTMGYSQEELIGKDPSILKHKSATRNIMDDMWNNLRLNKSWKGILKNVKKSGEIIYVNAEIYMDFDEAGNHIGYHSIHTDITTSVKNPHKFIFDNELFNLFFSDKEELMVVCLCKSDTNEKQRILEISTKLADLVGYSKEFIINTEMAFTDIIDRHCKYYKNLDLLMEDYRNDNEIYIKLRDTNNKTRTCRLSVTPFDYQGNLSRIFKLTDITKELEYSKQLTDISTAKNNFLANFSHEIRTPLNATIGFLNLLQIRETEKEKLDYINIILDSTTHLLDLMNDVIDFTTIDNKKLEIIPREFTPKDIQSTIEIFYAKSLEKGIEFTAYISPQLPDIMEQDILRLKQVISNLISNAIKFVNKGGKIAIDVHYYDGSLFLTVSDDGIGMTNTQLERIFKPFTQANKDTQLFYGGTGLGLSVVKDIIELMGGKIDVVSYPEKGSTFSIQIPTKLIKSKKIEGKLEVEYIGIYAPSFSEHKLNILSKYLIHFTSAKIDILESINNIENSVLIVHASDTTFENIKSLTKNNKIVLLKKINDLTQNFEELENVIEINMPILGSKLYDGLNGVLNNYKFKNISVSALDLHINGKILVADDLESNRLLIKELLSKYNIDLTLVENGKEAIDLYKANIKNNKCNYDIIILDMNMPIVSGSRAAASIRAFEQQLKIERTPIVALTANRYNTIDDKSLINMDEYISKPINLKHLLSIIIKYTSNISIDDTVHSPDKISKLKEIRDNFLNGNKFTDVLIYESKDFFTPDEYKLLLKFIDIKNDKRTFNLLYNDVMKLVRKTNQ